MEINKENFLRRLSNALYGMPYPEKQKVLAYYREMIEDKIENGESEAEVLRQLGYPEALAQKIRTAPPPPCRNGVSAIAIIGSIFLLVCVGIPIVLPIVISIIVIAFSILIAFFGATVGLVIAAIVLFFSSFSLFAGNGVTALFQLGVSLFLAGLGIFVCIGAFSLARGILNSMKYGFTTFTQYLAHKKGGQK